ncbi:hypothetical protein CM49_02692 [Paenibacillus sp. P1XP2]|nr:hypothetical protein CM49_02692 [Paenibacillus sp. P1XP2]
MKINRISHWVIPVIIILLAVYVYGGNFGQIKPIIEQTVGDEIVGEITEGQQIGQSFTSPVNNLSGFSIKLATFMRSNKGDITIGIKKEGVKTIYSTTVKASSIADNSFFDFRFPPIKHSKGGKYQIFIKSEGSSPGNSITAYMANQDIYKDGYLTVNNKIINGDLVFKVYYNRTFFGL